MYAEKNYIKNIIYYKNNRCVISLLFLAQRLSFQIAFVLFIIKIGFTNTFHSILYSLTESTMECEKITNPASIHSLRHLHISLYRNYIN